MAKEPVGGLFPKTLEAKGVLVEAMELALLAATTEVAAAEGVYGTVAEVAPWALSVSFGALAALFLQLTREMSNHVDQS